MFRSILIQVGVRYKFKLKNVFLPGLKCDLPIGDCRIGTYLGIGAGGNPLFFKMGPEHKKAVTVTFK